jgi:hypothetical protein
MPMKTRFLTLLVPLASAPALLVHADAPDARKPVPYDPFGIRSAAPAAPMRAARPSDEAIKAAIRATLDDMPLSAVPGAGDVLSSRPYREFARQVAQAKKAHCLGPDPLKHQPHSFVAKTPLGDYVIGVGGVYAAPFWAAAILRGKCNWTR